MEYGEGGFKAPVDNGEGKGLEKLRLLEGRRRWVESDSIASRLGGEANEQASKRPCTPGRRLCSLGASVSKSKLSVVNGGLRKVRLPSTLTLAHLVNGNLDSPVAGLHWPSTHLFA